MIEIKMVSVGRDRYMSLEEAIRTGHKPSLDPPTPSEPFFARGAIWNLLSVIVVATLAVLLNGWLYNMLTAIVG